MNFMPYVSFKSNRIRRIRLSILLKIRAVLFGPCNPLVEPVLMCSMGLHSQEAAFCFPLLINYFMYCRFFCADFLPFHIGSNRDFSHTVLSGFYLFLCREHQHAQGCRETTTVFDIWNLQSAHCLCTL